MFEAKTINFEALRLKLASPEDIRLWSHGEVVRPETINYRTQKPEKDGLFCERIFGPSKDWECYCGKYRKIRYKGIICDKCGVEITRSIVRRERMGHIELAASTSHIWFLRGVPSKIGLVLDLSIQTLEKVIYFADFIITQVDEAAREEMLHQIKGEFKTKRKAIEAEFNEQVNILKSKNHKRDNLRKQDAKPTESEISEDQALEERLIELNKMKEEKLKDLTEALYFAQEELKNLKPLKIISETTYQDLSLRYGHVFEAGIGAEAIRKLLEEINLDKLIANLEKEMKDSQGAKHEKVIRRLKLIKNFKVNQIRPEWMILTTVPVVPPDLRPMVPLDGGRFATSDLNDLYRRVINRNNRLKQLIELNAPEVICRNEKRMLQEAVDALIDNSARHGKTVVASTGQKRLLKSLADMLKGKQGRFRQNLLGKRIDYSGRSVIVVGPNLKLYQCGLPKTMALELFKPFIISRLIQEEYVHNVRSAARFIESGRVEVWDILEEIVREAIVLLNRAPTLHRLGIQAFRPVLIEGKAIQIHPLVCTAFNADFDGDQMAVHVPLTEEAKREAREIMLSTHNLLKPATGDPIVTPNQDIVWACFFMTFIGEDKKDGRLKWFSSEKEAVTAYNLGHIGLQEKIKARIYKKSQEVKNKVAPYEILETSVGRIIFNQVLPEKISYLNKVVAKKDLKEIVKLTLEYSGPEKTAQLLDNLKEISFEYLTRSGLSWGMDDLPVLDEKQRILAEADSRIDETRNQYETGLLTEEERHTKIIEIWMEARDKIVKISQDSLDIKSPVYSMIESNARGSWGQLTQIVGMKGLVSNPAGEIIELPVRGSFKEGFDVLEYFISTHGSRKGLSDTALRTANAGYLTRRLIDVAQDVIVTQEDCGDSEGVELIAEESEEMGKTLVDRLVGRVILDPLVDPKTKRVLVKKNTLVTEVLARKLKKIPLKKARIRSVINCQTEKGVCRLCYGYDLGYNKLVELGTAIGIIAAQSIGEPGTQLTMRTFHTGGVAGIGDITQGLPRVEELFETRIPKRKAFISDIGGLIKIEEAQRSIEGPEGTIVVSSQAGQKIIKIYHHDLQEDEYRFKNKNVKISVQDNQKIEKGDVLLEMKEGKTVKAKRGGIARLEKNKIKIIVDEEKVKEFIIPPGYAIWVKDGEKVLPGDIFTDGSLDLHQLFKLKGRIVVQKYLIKEIQDIYSSQGQDLNDKHIEVIARQLFSKVYIQDAGDTNLLPGEIVDKAELAEAQRVVLKQKNQPAEARELLLGITKVSLATRSFLSAASFQETARVLINAAITGKIDYLEGLKENVIIGRLIPAGTGFRK